MSYGHSFYFAYEILAVSSSEDAAIFFFTKNTLVKKGALWKQELH